jgi:hypothetical protein
MIQLENRRLLLRFLGFSWAGRWAGLWTGLWIGLWALPVFAQNSGTTATVVPSRESIAESSLSTIVFNATASPRTSWSQSGSETIVGRIVDFNAANIIYQLPPDETLKTRNANDVTKITFEWLSEDASEANKAFESGSFADVIRRGKLAIAGGQLPSWQQRFLVTKMVEAFWQSNQKVIAGRLFLSLLKDTSPPLVYAWAPLIWQPTKVDSAMTEVALVWIKESESFDSQLLGASWLLETSDSSGAIEALQRVTRLPNLQLARLATAQLWRVATPKEVASKFQEWRSVRDLLPVALQLGPTLTIAEKLERASLQTEALDEYIRIIAVEPSKSFASMLAKKRASEILRSLNRPEEANRLLPSS